MARERGNLNHFYTQMRTGTCFFVFFSNADRHRTCARKKGTEGGIDLSKLMNECAK